MCVWGKCGVCVQSGMSLRHVQLFVPHGLWPSNKLLCLWYFPGRTLGGFASSFSRISSQPRSKSSFPPLPVLTSRFFTTAHNLVILKQAIQLPSELAQCNFILFNDIEFSYAKIENDSLQSFRVLALFTVWFHYFLWVCVFHWIIQWKQKKRRKDRMLRTSRGGCKSHSWKRCMSFPWPDLVIKPHTTASMSFPVCSVGKESSYNAGDTGPKGSIPGQGRSPGGGGMATYCPILAWSFIPHGQRSLVG